MKRAFDGDLLGYMLYFIRKKLRKDLLWLAIDIRGETLLAISLQPNLRNQLYPYMERNEIPKGRDLMLLRSVMYNQRLKWLYIEKRMRHRRLGIIEEDNLTKSYMEEHREEDL